MVGEMGPWSLVSGKLFSRGRFSSFEGWWWYFSPYSDVIETKGESKFSLPTVVKNRKFLAEQHTMTVSSASSIFLKERERERERDDLWDAISKHLFCQRIHDLPVHNINSDNGQMLVPVGLTDDFMWNKMNNSAFWLAPKNKSCWDMSPTRSVFVWVLWRSWRWVNMQPVSLQTVDRRIGTSNTVDYFITAYQGGYGYSSQDVCSSARLCLCNYKMVSFGEEQLTRGPDKWKNINEL